MANKKIKMITSGISSLSKVISTILVVIFLTIITIGCFINIVSFLANKDEDLDTVADGYTIERYNVVLDVGEDNKIDVTEKISVNFTSEYKHGIYKITPQWLKYTGKDGKTIKRKSIISNYEAVNDPYVVDIVDAKKRIRIGDANKYVKEGLKTYTINYTYNMGKDPFKNFDEFIFHAYGDYWGTEIKNASIQVNMPKNIEGYNINFFTDKNRKNNVNDVVDYSINGNTLYAAFNENKNYEKQYEEFFENEDNQNYNTTWFDKYEYEPLKKSLTVDIELPEGYFEGGSWNYGFKSIILIIIIFILTIRTIYKWIKFGKDHAKRIQTVEYYPPEDFNSAEIGYIYNKKRSNKKLTISLIIQLASKGYIKIDELNDKDNNIQITNLAPVITEPKEVKDYKKSIPKRTIKVRKLKDIDTSLSRSETTIMNYLFKTDNERTIRANIDKFLKVKDNLIKNKYIEIVEDNENEINEITNKKLKEYEQALEKYNKEKKIYDEKMSNFAPLTKMEKIVYDRLLKQGEKFILSEHKTLYMAFSDVEDELNNTLKDKIHDKQATKELWKSLFRNILIIIFYVASYVIFEDMDPKLSILYTLSFICIFINLFFTIFMKRKTEYGEEIYARVKGFRQFLITAEKPKLEALVDENPSYFYNILPYTYVLNISKKWIDKFEDIQIPKIDMGTFNYNSDLSFHTFYSDIYIPPSTSGSSSGGCSSSGCSSCGGGCSSCGGGGSW